MIKKTYHKLLFWLYELTPNTIKFNNLPQACQRMVIAKDVIKHIHTEQYHANTGSYLTDVLFKDEFYYTIKNTSSDEIDIKSNIDELNSCTVCALGACLLSTTRFKNRLKLSDIDNAGAGFNSKASDLLLNTFSSYQLALIEGAFENGFNCTINTRFARAKGDLEGISDGDERKVIRFYGKYRFSEDRLIAIMENIIANDGEFTP